MLTDYGCYISDFCLAQAIHMIASYFILLQDLALPFLFQSWMLFMCPGLTLGDCHLAEGLAVL